jgi:hypothetical protein
MGEAPRASAAEHGEAGEQRHGEHRRSGRGPRRQGREPQPRRDGTAASVARLDEARPRRAAKTAPKAPRTEDGDGAHLPAFLLRPVRVKA